MRSARSSCSAGPPDVEIGLRISAVRSLLGKSQEELASAVGVSRQQIQKYERGTDRVSAARLVQMATYLGLRPGELLEGSGSQLGLSSEMAVLIATPGAASLLRDYARIIEPAHQQALLATAQSLAASASRGTRVGPK